MLFAALEQAEVEAIRHRGSMFWREQDGGAISSLFRPARASARSGLRRLQRATPPVIGLTWVPEEGDLWPVRVSMGQKLLSVPRFDQVVVGVNGAMARMRTVHPLHFARIKRQLSKDPNRDPRKKAKDVAQADMAQALVKEYLPHLTSTAEAGIKT